MAIKRRLRAEYWLVSKNDSALDECHEELVAYSRSYDLRHLEPWLAAHPDAKPTKFRCKPLDARWHRRLDSMTAGDFWVIFSEHVTAIENLLDENDREIAVHLEGAGADKRVPDRFRDDGSLPAEVYMEIAQAVIHRGTTGDNTPFGSPDIWREWLRTRASRNHARQADAVRLIGSASAKTSQRSAPSTSESAAPSDASAESTVDGAP